MTRLQPSLLHHPAIGPPKKGKGKLPLFRGNGEQVNPIYGVGGVGVGRGVGGRNWMHTYWGVNDGTRRRRYDYVHNWRGVSV